jgi:hypothetical protein
MKINKYKLPFIICFLLSSFKIFAQSDNCATATSLGIVTTNTTTTGTIVGATADQTDPSCFVFNQNVWYTFTVPAAGGSYNITVATNGGGTALQYPDVAVFSGACGAFTELGCNTNNSNFCTGSGTISNVSVNASCLSAGIYYIAVDDDYYGCSGLGTAGTFSITVTKVNAGVAVPGNDNCGSAVNLGTVNTTTTTTGNNFCATADDASPTCFTYLNNVWYKFTVPAAGGSYQITVANSGAAGTLQYPDVTLMSGACGGFTELSCNSASVGFGNGTTSSITVDGSCLAAGTYYISVDDDAGATTGSSEGTFSITVTKVSAGVAAPGNDNCGSATNLGTVSTTTTVAGNNNCATADDTSPTCFTYTNNVWYKFTVPAGGGSYMISVTGGSILNPDVTVMSGSCGGFTEIDCNGVSSFSSTDATASSTTVAVTANCKAAGTYYISVDDDAGGGGGMPGTFSITVTKVSAGTGAPANDNCASAISLGSVSTTTTVAGNNNCATIDQTDPSCFPFVDNVWYTFTVPAGGGSYHVSVASGSLVNPDVAVFSGTCGATLTELSCFDQCDGQIFGTSTTSSIATDASCLAAGTYYVAVDDDNNGCGGGTGSFSLTVTQSAAGNAGPANNACASAISLGTVSTTTTTTGNNFCATSDQTSPVCFTYTNNVWYTFTVPAGGGNYEVTVNCGTMVNPNVVVFSGGCGAFTELNCNSQCNGDYTGTPSSISVFPTCLAAGTYYISVDDDNSLADLTGCGGTEGTFSVVVTQLSAGGDPANDLCTGAVTLTTGTVKAGSNACATSAGDPSSTCEASGTNATVWYTYTPATNGSATFSVSAGTIGWPAVSVFTGTCSSFSEIGCASAASSGGSASVVTGCLTAGTTYYIMVDYVSGNSGSVAGTFSIVATYTTVATGAPSNNCCSSPAQITTLNGTCLGGYTTTGATFDQYVGACMGTGNNNVWFSFVAQGSSATITVTGAANFHPQVMIFAAPNLCSATGVTSYGCATSAGASVSVSNSTNLVAGNTYYAMVTNSSTGTAGSFSICINNPIATPVPGQDCKSALQVCNNSNLGGNASGTGSVNDLTSTNEGCLSTGEHESNWFVVNINTGGTLDFTIAPTANYDDYDFALWGPYTSTAVPCPPAAKPITCNYSALPPNTGLTTSSTFTSQGAGGSPWNAPLNVITGDAYIMVIDNYSTITEPFALNWGGTAILSCNPVIILAVQLLNFTAVLNEDKVNLNWSTTSEIDNDYFTLERSPDGINFESLTTLKGSGTSTQKNDYSFVDYKPLPGQSYYRLSQTDYNGVIKRLSIQAVINTNNDGMFSVVPNPTDGVVNISYYCNAATGGTLKLYNSNGVSMLSKDFVCTAGANSSQLNLSDISPGIYLITFSTNDKFYSTKLIKR